VTTPYDVRATTTSFARAQVRWPRGWWCGRCLRCGGASADAHAGGLAGGLAGGRRARGDTDLGQHRRDVVVHRPLRDEQPRRDLPVRQALGEQGQDLLLAGRQPGRGRPRGRPRAARDRAHAELLHPPPGRRRGGPGAHLIGSRDAPSRHSRPSSPSSCEPMSNSGPSGRGSQQAVAGTPQPAGSPRILLEGLDQRRLADPGLPGHQHQAPVPAPGLAGVLRQQAQEGRPLQQLHRATPHPLEAIVRKRSRRTVDFTATAGHKDLDERPSVAWPTAGPAPGRAIR